MSILDMQAFFIFGRFKMRTTIIIAIVMMLLQVLSASAAIVTGRVTDLSGDPIDEVNITVEGESYMPSDSDGRFSLDVPNPKGKSITFTHVGFKPLMLKIRTGEELNVSLEPSVYHAEGVTVHASRAQISNPSRPYSSITSDEIKRDYLISEFPLLLESVPNLYSFADAGGGMGYSYIKIRGFDDRRISVYVNGVPLNDPEDQATYFVDLPDFAAEVTDIQIERGIGNSLYGDASFGGSVNIVSAAIDRDREISLLAGYGEYTADGSSVGTMRKQAFEYSSGLIGGRWSFAGRYSNLWSDGYRKNSWYDGTSYFLSVSRLDPGMVTTMNVYGGPMTMHLAYYGIEKETLESDRRYNPLEYDNETDNFNQPHYELHNAYRLSDNMTLNNTFYYIRGKGYYEQYKGNRSFYEYNIPPVVILDDNNEPVVEIDRGDLVRQQWVIKNHYGFNPRLDIEHDRGSLTIGGAFYLFDSEHWGQVVWAEGLDANQIDPRHKYYEYFGDKFSGSLYIGETYDASDKARLSLSLQTRYIKQDFDQTRMGAFVEDNDYDLDWLFLSPRVGFGYDLNNKINLSAAFAISSRTPADYSIYDANDPYTKPSLDVEPERVYDFELGGLYRDGKREFGVNLYWMELRNEIIPSGGVDDDGYDISVNADRSVHAGIETTAGIKIHEYLNMSGNLSVTYDRARDFKITQRLYDNSNDWSPVGTVVADYSGNPVPYFPTYLGNLMADLHYDRYRLVTKGRFVGRQYIDNYGTKDISIDPYFTMSAVASLTIPNPAGYGRLQLSASVENIFDEKYETSGFAETYLFRDSPNQTYAYYIPAAERSFFLQLKLEMD